MKQRARFMRVLGIVWRVSVVVMVLAILVVWWRLTGRATWILGGL